MSPALTDHAIHRRRVVTGLAALVGCGLIRGAGAQSEPCPLAERLAAYTLPANQ
jgi:hypothetical protein